VRAPWVCSDHCEEEEVPSSIEVVSPEGSERDCVGATLAGLSARLSCRPFESER
jgi:hypothetical protein